MYIYFSFGEGWGRERRRVNHYKDQRFEIQAIIIVLQKNLSIFSQISGV
jgi:hypothetical protein